jgi:hypothetical protein
MKSPYGVIHRKDKKNGDKAYSDLKLFLIGNMSDKYFPDGTQL